MSNHYHLLIETPEANLSRMMRDLNGHYTIYFNQRHSRTGHLLQGRYKAILVEKGAYLLELSRYIHLNPVRADIVSKPEDYHYSSMAYYLGKEEVPAWLNVNFILEQFGNSFPNQQNQQNQQDQQSPHYPQDPQNAYKRFVYNGIIGSKNPLKNAYASTILGSEGFIEKVRGTLSRKGGISEQVSESKRLKYGKELSDIAKVVLEYFNVDREALTRRKVKFNNAKKVFVYYNGLGFLDQ